MSTVDLNEVLDLTSGAVWEGLRGQSLFITGGTGFVGKWLLEGLLHANRKLDLGLKLTVLTREPERFTHSSAHLANAPAVTLVQGDVVDFEFPGGEFSSIIHAALPVTALRSGESELRQLAEAGTRRVCDFGTARGTRRFLHISSGAVYGAQHLPTSLAEDSVWNEADAANDYTRAKRATERVVGQNWPFDVVIARCFAFIGPCLLPSSGAAAAQFIEAAACGGGIVVQGTGEAMRSYQYASDMTRWLLSCLVLGAPGRAYNIGGDANITIAELARKVTYLAGTDMPVRLAGRPMPGLAGSWYVPDLRRASGELGLHNAVDLEEGIRRTLGWRRASGPSSTAST